MEQFIGRSKELAALNDAYAFNATRFIPIYGRRRVGKSQLILQFIEDKASVYFLGKQTSRRLQIKDFMEATADGLGRPSLAGANPDDWRNAIQLAVDSKPEHKKLVIVLDEFQWMVETSEELPSVLQQFLDRDWKNRNDVMLILCGSYIGFMEREVLGAKSPLFGRRHGQIHLQPFSYLEAAEFHPNWGIENQAKAYFICGGIPFYHEFFKSESSVNVAIERHLFREESALFHEPNFLLREELAEVRRYYAILTALGTRSMSGKDIEQMTGIDERKLSYYIQKLIELGYVRKRVPLIPDIKARGKRARYTIDDALLTFWFRFVHPNTGFIAQMGAKESFRSLVAPHLDSWFGSRFESLCQHALPRIYLAEGINVPFEVGEYWDAKVQIDMVGVRRNEAVDVCECKWGKLGSIPKLAREVQGKCDRYPLMDGLSIQPRVFTRSSVAESKTEKTGIRWHSLASMMELND